MNTRRMNRLEELGRVDSEKAYTKKGKRNLKDEKKRVVDELKMKKGGGVSMTSMMKDKEGRAMAKNKKKMTKSQKADAAGRAMMGKPVSTALKRGFDKAMADSKKARGKKMMGGGKVKGYKAGGMADKEGRALVKKTADARGRAMKSGGAIMKAKGKGTQGYNARLDESLGVRKGKASTKSQSYKARRDESKGMKKAAGKKAYSGNRSSAQGSASKRADGIARKGRTKGRMV